jgi:hypothetical protein
MCKENRGGMSDRELWNVVGANLYEVLGVAPAASDEAIQQAWHRAARLTHPDVGGDDQQFESVHVAYLVLSDPEQRRRYDAWRQGPAITETVQQEEAPLPPDAPFNPGAPPAPTNPRTLWLMVLVGLGCLVAAYLWPWTTILIGFGVGFLVTTRYIRARRTRV